MEHLLPFGICCVVSQDPDNVFLFQGMAVFLVVHVVCKLLSGHDVFWNWVAGVDIVDDEKGGCAPGPEVGIFL